MATSAADKEGFDGRPIAAAAGRPLTIPRDFSRVVLTQENVLVADEKLLPTPSMVDGLSFDTEMDLRVLGCELIQTSGILLQLPQVGTD